LMFTVGEDGDVHLWNMNTRETTRHAKEYSPMNHMQLVARIRKKTQIVVSRTRFMMCPVPRHPSCGQGELPIIQFAD